MDSQHLLVPIKVQALVIDDTVIERSVPIEIDGRIVANDGRWTPQLYSYNQLLISLKSPGPSPFYGAQRTYRGGNTDQLVMSPGLLPQPKDRGVYLHWVLPSGLRHAYKEGAQGFPPLPDQWLIVRFSRSGPTSKTRAWFIDGGAIAGETSPNLLLPAGDKYAGKSIGKVTPLEKFATADFSGQRTTITAIGNEHTGSPTFTANIAENRNIFSWHDKLEDLRVPEITGKVKAETTLTYCVLGWYREPQNEPLAVVAPKVVERRDATDKLVGWLIDPPGWSIDASSAPPADLLKRRSVFHGMVAHINYWSAGAHKGTILGYPGAPPVGGTLSQSIDAFKVGVGNNAEDALVSLVSSEYSGQQQIGSLAEKQPNLWKALEAVIYRQSETLVKNWNVAPRDTTVHQNWFTTHDAGRTWYIRPVADQHGAFPADADQTAEQTAARPTAEHLGKLKELNQAQAEVDDASRDLGALQQELYVRWWKLVHKSRQADASLELDEKNCRAVAKEVETLRNNLEVLIKRLSSLPDALKQKLPNTLELKYDAAPRFWLPADPVIVVKNCGTPSKHQFPRELPCRLPEQIINSAKVSVDRKDPKTFSAPADVAEIATAARTYLPACPQVLDGLLDEASIVEQAVRNLVERTAKPFNDARAWSSWTNRLVHDLAWSGDPDSIPFDEVTLQPEAAKIYPYRLVDLWVKQPWSPLFLDWQITWFPTPPTAENPFGETWSFREADFIPSDRESIPRKGYTVRGRSLLSPIDERIFKEPIDTLGKLLDSGSRSGKQKDSNFPPAVVEVLKRYEIVWSETLRKLPRGGLMGQALTGFHQALLHRDLTLPRIAPSPSGYWIKPDEPNDSQRIEILKSLENEVRKLLEVPKDSGVKGESLGPPALPQPAEPVPFSLTRSGAMRIDELWLVDDFGQSADLLGYTAARSKASSQVFHPRMRWHDHHAVFAMPPRVVQPARLNFRFTPASESSNEASNSEPALSSICGWIFFNPLDQALVLCDRKGELMGHLAIVKEQQGVRIKWEEGAAGVAITSVSNPTLKAFAESLVQGPAPRPRLLELLNLIDNALERIRPSGERRDTILVGRPLALVNASVGLELFGNAWTDPYKDPPGRREGTGDQSLNALRLRINLGYSYSVEDGLIGYFREGAYQQIVVPELSDKVTASDYIGAQKDHGLRVGFGSPERITMLMDPWGSVQAACGIVPAKTITLAHPELNKIVAQMEASFRVGPVLVQPNRLALPAPTGNKGTWNFTGPLTEQKAAALVALDPRYFSDQPVVATEGRLLLLNEE